MLRIANQHFVRCIVICHRSVFLDTAERQQRQELFTHRTSRLGKRKGQILRRRIDRAINRETLLSLPELVLLRSFVNQRDFHSDFMVTRVRRIERLCCVEVRPFLELDLICAVCERQAE